MTDQERIEQAFEHQYSFEYDDAEQADIDRVCDRFDCFVAELLKRWDEYNSGY
jgi:hypothetical protein